ncbi:MAG TPA: M23 family metallopeptidase [Anaerolineae bacterium]
MAFFVTGERAMTIGAVLLQPQRIGRSAAADPIAGLAADLLNLAVAAAQDPAGYEPALASLGEAMAALAARVQARSQTGSAAAIAHLKGLVAPLLTEAQGLGQTLAGAADAEAALQAFLALAAGLGEKVANLTAAQITGQVGVLLQVLQADLGLTNAYIVGEIWATLDDMIARAEAAPPGSDATSLAKRLEVAAVLRRARRLLRNLLDLPEFDAGRLAEILLNLLRRSGLAEILRQIACVGKDVDKASKAGQALLHLVATAAGGHPAPALAAPASPATLEPVAPQPGREEYCWYATWLLHDKDLPLFGTGDLNKPDQVAGKIKSDPAAIYGYLRQKLSADTTAALNTYSSGKPPDDLQLALVVDLNRLIQGPSIYDADRFRGVTISEHTQKKLDEHPSGDDLVELNRKLLEDAFGDALDRLNRHWYQEVLDYMKDELVLKSITWPGKHVYVDRDRKHVMFDDIPLHAGTDLTWKQAPIFDPDANTEGRMHYTFEHVGPDALEIIAYVTALIVDTANLIWHLTEIQPNHQISPIWFATYDLGQGLSSGIARRPYSGLGFTGANWLEALIGAPMVGTAFTAIQGNHTHAAFTPGFMFWLVKWILDTMNFTAPNTNTFSPNAMRDILLSTLTLFNFKGPGDYPSTLPEAPAENRKQMDPWVDFFVGLFTNLLAGAVNRKDYGLKGMPGTVVAIWLAGGFGISIAGGALGGLIGEIIAWAEDWALWGKTMILQWPKVWLGFLIALYGAKEGDTDDGKYNATGGDFAGYPDKSKVASPYWLPYTAGDTYFVDQGNQGLVSHNYLANPGLVQVYAYDLALDNGDVILASRPGTVVAFRESIADNGGDDWNYIQIRHDVDENGKLLSVNMDDATHTSKDATHAAHDRDAGGSVVITFAEYGHGKQNGVTNAFALWTTPVPTASIVGTRVKRGQPIMLADHTGNSLHNHVHMHVLAGMPPAAPGDPNEPANWTPKNYSVPFVYQDVSSDNGVCKANHWYTSQNQKKLA